MCLGPHILPMQALCCGCSGVDRQLCTGQVYLTPGTTEPLSSTDLEVLYLYSPECGLTTWGLQMDRYRITQ